jgi:tRNA dimethylallyltransferase
MLLDLVPDADVDPANRNRVMRRLEKLHDGDCAQPSARPRYETLKIGVSWDRETLKKRIDERLDRRTTQGMIDEVRNLRARGASDEFLLKLGLEYRYITEYLTGRWPTEDEMLHELSLAIKRFAKRQMTWFKRDKSIHWLDMAGDPISEASALIEAFLQK